MPAANAVARIEIEIAEPVRRLVGSAAGCPGLRTIVHKAAGREGWGGSAGVGHGCRGVEDGAEGLLETPAWFIRPGDVVRFESGGLPKSSRPPGAPGAKVGMPQPGVRMSTGRKPTEAGRDWALKRRASDSKSPQGLFETPTGKKPAT